MPCQKSLLIQSYHRFISSDSLKTQRASLLPSQHASLPQEVQ